MDNSQNSEPIENRNNESFDYNSFFTSTSDTNHSNRELLVQQPAVNIEVLKTCNKCLQQIPVNAKICSHCNSYQSGWLKTLKPYENFLAIIISGFISALAIYYSSFYSKQQVDAAYQQIELAKKETAKAEEAKRKAEEASGIALTASEKALTASEVAIDAQKNAKLSLVNAQNTLKKVNLIKDDLEKQRTFNLNLMSLNENYAFIFFTDSSLNYLPIEHYFNPITDINSMYGWSNVFHQSYYYSINRNKSEKFQYYSDLIEASFIKWYSSYFGSSWYIKSRDNGIINAGSNGDQFPGEYIKGESLINYFNDNEILVNSYQFYKTTANWRLPAKVEIERKRTFFRDTIKGIYQKSSFQDEIIFTHKLFKVTVSINMYLPYELDNLTIGQLNISNKQRPNKMKIGYCRIKYTVKLEKDFVFNEENSRYYYWIKDFNEGIKSSFDWHNLKN